LRGVPNRLRQFRSALGGLLWNLPGTAGPEIIFLSHEIGQKQFRRSLLGADGGILNDRLHPQPALRAVAVHLSQLNAETGRSRVIEAIAAAICAVSIAGFVLYAFDLLHPH
jgi:hypothetical protein